MIKGAIKKVQQIIFGFRLSAIIDQMIDVVHEHASTSDKILKYLKGHCPDCKSDIDSMEELRMCYDMLVAKLKGSRISVNGVSPTTIYIAIYDIGETVRNLLDPELTKRISKLQGQQQLILLMLEKDGVSDKLMLGQEQRSMLWSVVTELFNIKKRLS